MAVINAHTKIAAILKDKPEALEAIISISPRFNKLRNPLLRKIMAARATIQMASKVGGCTVEDFFEKLQPLGFVIDRASLPDKEDETSPLPAFMKKLAAEKVNELDVRPVIESGQDPFKMIMAKVKGIEPGQILKLINSFEPVPLIDLLGKQGFESYVQTVDENCAITYFHKTADVKIATEDVSPTDESEWEAAIRNLEGKLIYADVRHLEMPLPMLTILDKLENLPAGHALFVYHKRIPVFLLPELRERNFEFLIKEISDAEVHLLIVRKNV
ncbi:MAG: DUF2249 domain-containing protein [Bacteroidetes bacterium]|nr:DUF2249 domain-containing protein [Bacteroidota bacterium]MBS1540208.1 DUF2249 domain-containing protein [Bacteroidota bacterium]